MDNKLKIQKTKQETGLLISKLNEEMIKKCDIVIANITPFRGPSLDAGTAFEIGFASALNKVIYGYSNKISNYNDRINGKYIKDKNDNLIYVDENNMSIEDFDLIDNLMIPGTIFNKRNKIFTINTSIEDRFTNLIAFEKCLKDLEKKHE